MFIEKIVVIEQKKYAKDELYEKVNELFLKNGLFDELKNKGAKRILLKPNLLGIYPESSAVITHPDLVYAISRTLYEKGYEVGIGDSSGSDHRMDQLFELNGYDTIFKDGLASAENFEVQPFKKIKVAGREIHIAGAFDKYDYFISIPKLKTHNITTITCAIKNFYGIIPGAKKSHYHREFYRFNDFNRFIIDIYDVIRADFYVVDAIIGMEGDGPAGGIPREFGMLAAGRDGAKIDAFFLMMMGINADEIDYYHYLEQKDLYNGISPEDFDLFFEYGTVFKNFILPISNTLSSFSKLLPPFALNFLYIRPEIDRRKCDLCGTCVLKCPVDAMKINNKVLINKKSCIACGCCKEVCPQEAIKMRGNTIMKLLRCLKGAYEKHRKRKR